MSLRVTHSNRDLEVASFSLGLEVMGRESFRAFNPKICGGGNTQAALLVSHLSLVGYPQAEPDRDVKKLDSCLC